MVLDCVRRMLFLSGEVSIKKWVICVNAVGPYSCSNWSSFLRGLGATMVRRQGSSLQTQAKRRTVENLRDNVTP